MKARTILSSLFFLLLTSTWPLMAQDSYMFKHLDTKNGLSNSQVNYIFKDSKGFMWFGTASGLNRYDGYNYKIFRHKESIGHSIADNFVDLIQEDADGNLWIHTGVGYVFFDSKKEVFVNNLAEIMKGFGINHIPSVVYIDEDKNFWFYVMNLGGFSYLTKTKTLHFYPQNQKNGLSKGLVTCIRTLKDKGVFLFDNGAVDIVDKNSSRIVMQNHFMMASTQYYWSDKYSLFIDSDGDFWIYSKGASGVWVWYRKSNRWEHYSNGKQSKPYRLSSDVVQDITQDVHGKIWLATDHGGVDIIDKRKGSLVNLKNNLADDRSLSHNSINCVYCDDVGIVWIGTYKKGVSYYSESTFKFGVEHFTSLQNSGNFESDITYIEEDGKGNLWVGTNGSGLIQINRLTGEKTIFKNNPSDASSLSADVIVGLCQASDGKLWIATYLGGLNCFDGRKFIRYNHNPKNPNSLVNNNVWSVVEDEKGMIWIGTLGGGLQMLNPATGKFITYQADKYLTSNYVSSLFLGKNRKMFIGTAIGLTVFDMNKGSFERFNGNRAGTQQFSSLNVNQVYEDSRGLLWVATRDGLNIFNFQQDQIRILRKADGLADDIICAIVEDQHKNMWITTANGVSNVVVSEDPQTRDYKYSFNNYDSKDGLQGNEFNIRSIAGTRNGEIIMGGLRGLNYFFPDKIKYNQILPKVSFTGITLFNEEVQIDSVYSGHKILVAALNKTNKVELKYRQNVFSISFSGMDYILPEKCRFAYMLEGFNPDWLYVDGSVHEVTYTNLAPGTYTFKVKAANSDGYWNEEAATLTIVIRPPFWRTYWAYALYGLLLVGLLILARRMVLRAERNRFRIRQIEMEAERKHELDDMKLRFFTNVSHELRTPLTLIISPIDGLIKSMESEEHKQKLMVMKRNAFRLLNLVNEILDFRKSDVQGNVLKPVTADAMACIRNACLSFADLSDKKNVKLSLKSAIHALNMDFDEDKLNKILMNLLSNAFKFTDAGGRVDVVVCLSQEEGNADLSLQVSVADTGIGIKDEDKQRIFDRFYQVQHGDAHDFGGSGIGLHMVKEFVNLHGGQIQITDNVGGGSVFTFTIPVVNGQESFDWMDKGAMTEEVIIDGKDTASNAFKQNTPELSGKDIPLLLIVDDNEDFRSFMKESLSGYYRIREARNGREAWVMIPDLQPDLIISDVMMPEMDGTELCSMVKNDVRTSHIPLILLTARTAEEHKLEGLEIGADDYITKPFNFEILSLRIKKMLEFREVRRSKFTKQIDPEPSEITITPLDEKLIKKAILYVENNISRSELSVEELSRELGMSRVHLYKKLIHITGKSPVEFIRTLRLKRAAQLLRESQMNISEIAYEVGFNNPKYFSKYFKDEFGMLPSAYMAEMKKEPGNHLIL
ncbi:MAG: response regulator [Bacteroides sp.]|nr:response regulator [Bacteroides sp.]